MNLQGHHTPTAPSHPARHPANHPDGGKGGKGKDGPKGHKKPAAHHPAKHPPARHRPSKPQHKGRKTAGRGEVELIWFDDSEFAPLAKSEHIH